MKLIVCKAHEVVLETYSKDRYVCLRCNKRGQLSDMFGHNDCTPHFEYPTSGWLGEEVEFNTIEGYQNV